MNQHGLVCKDTIAQFSSLGYPAPPPTPSSLPLESQHSSNPWWIHTATFATPRQWIWIAHLQYQPQRHHEAKRGDEKAAGQLGAAARRQEARIREEHEICSSAWRLIGDPRGRTRTTNSPDLLHHLNFRIGLRLSGTELNTCQGIGRVHNLYFNTDSASSEAHLESEYSRIKS